jgi:hypothetical protein
VNHEPFATSLEHVELKDLVDFRYLKKTANNDASTQMTTAKVSRPLHINEKCTEHNKTMKIASKHPLHKAGWSRQPTKLKGTVLAGSLH